MPSENPQPEGDLLPFGAPQVDPVDPSVRAKLTKASSGQQKIERNPRALRPLWYSIPILVIVLTVAAYLIGLSLWSRSSLSHWKAQEYDVALAGYDGQMTWTQIGIERWVAHYNRGTTLVRQGQTDEGVTELRTAFDLVPKATVSWVGTSGSSGQAKDYVVVDSRSTAWGGRPPKDAAQWATQTRRVAYELVLDVDGFQVAKRID